MQVLMLLALGVPAVADSPVSKVVQLLGELQAKVLKDGEIEQKQYEKFAEWCEEEAVKTQYEIKDGKAKVEGLNAAIEKATAQIQDADSNIESLVSRVSVNEKDLQAATEIRDKERRDFEASDRDLAESIDMLGRAIGIIDREMRGASFAQVSSRFHDLTAALDVIVQGAVFSTSDKARLQALLQSDDELAQPEGAPAPSAYENQSGGILSTLEDMKDKAVTMRNDAQKAEMNQQHSFEMLAQSLKDALKADNKDLDENRAAKAAASEAKGTAEGNLANTQKTLAEDEKALAGLATDCQQKAADWETSQKSRAEELQALVDAKKIIEGTTGGAASRAYDLLETQATSSSSSVAGRQVVDSLKRLGAKNSDVAMTQLALRVNAALQMNLGDDVFAKVRGMIEDMVDKLLAQAKQEADHKAFCDSEMAETQAKMADHDETIGKLTAKIDKASAAIAQLTQDIAQAQSDLTDLAKSQAAMDEMRASEKAEFQVAKKDYEDGVEGLTMALKILRDYYASSEALIQQPAVGTHAKDSGAATGIIGMLEVAQSDFSKLLADAEVEEAAAQAQYDKVSQENEVNKAIKEADLRYNTKEKTGLEKSVADLKNDREGEQSELDAVTEYYDKLRPGCIEKPMSYADRKARREAEIAGLKEALSILGEEAPEAFLALRSVRRS